MVGDATPGLVVLCYTRKQAEPAIGTSLEAKFLYSFCFSSCLQVPAFSFCPDSPSAVTGMDLIVK